MPSKSTYDAVMRDTPAVLTLKLDNTEPIELDAFVGAFTALAEEYIRFARETGGLDLDPRVYVKEVRKGSIVADLMPVAQALLMAADTALYLQTLEDFAHRWGGRIKGLASGRFPDPENKSNAKHWMDMVKAVACDPNGKATLATAVIEDGSRRETYSISFDTAQAIQAVNTIEGVYRRIQESDNTDHQRVLMIFTRSDVGNAKVGRPSGERVIIEELSARALALTYASQLAEERIKYHIQQSPDNIFKKGFVVDVNVQTKGGRPVAYSVVHVHEVIDLPDDTDDDAAI
jgi:hypothetical protein